MNADETFPMGHLWFPLLALAEGDSSGAEPGRATRVDLGQAPSPALKQALLALREALREEPIGASAQRLWLLLDTAPAQESVAGPLEVGRVLDELRRKFQDLRRDEATEPPPDFEAFLREKMRSLGFDDLGTAPLLPDLQREALRGLGVGLGSQMAQLLGRLAGWHGENKAPKAKTDEESARGPAGVKLLRLELSPELATDKAWTSALRQEVGRVRKKISQRVGWEISGFQLAANRELESDGWRVLLRGEPIAVGRGKVELLESLEPMVGERAEALFPFAEFEAMMRQPGCKLVVKELRALGLEKAALWTVCRKALAGGGHLRELH